MLRHWFLEHPHSVGESYFGHQRAAFGFGSELFAAAAACFIHGLIPGLFQRTGSGTVARLHARMSARHRPADATPRTPALPSLSDAS